MNRQGADISDIAGDYRVRQAVENPEGPFPAAGAEGEDSAAEASELSHAEFSVRASFKQRIIDLNAVYAVQCFCKLPGVAADSLHAEPQGFESGDIQKGIRRRQSDCLRGCMRSWTPCAEIPSPAPPPCRTGKRLPEKSEEELRCRDTCGQLFHEEVWCQIA